MRNSKQKDIVYSTLCENRIHPTADELFSIIKEKQAEVGVATVYRNLSKLADIGKIRKITGLDGVAHYDSRLDSHYHFICEVCGCIRDIEESELGFVGKTNLLQDCRITSVDITLRGFFSFCEELMKNKTMSEKEKMP